MNVDGCRVGTDDVGTPIRTPERERDDGWGMGFGSVRDGPASPSGRWPANVIHDGSDEVLAGFPVSTSNGGTKPNPTSIGGNGIYGGGKEQAYFHFGDTGSAARFFYCAKASRADRDEGLEEMPLRGKNEVYGNGLNTAMKLDPTLHTAESVAARPQRHNHHPTVKPTDLMRWLVRLVTPPGGLVLDPFMGSGSTGKAAVIENMAFVGIEQDAEYLEIARRRIEAAKLPLFTEAKD